MDKRTRYEIEMQLAGKGLEIEPCKRCELPQCICQSLYKDKEVKDENITKS